MQSCDDQCHGSLTFRNTKETELGFEREGRLAMRVSFVGVVGQ